MARYTSRFMPMTRRHSQPPVRCRKTRLRAPPNVKSSDGTSDRDPTFDDPSRTNGVWGAQPGLPRDHGRLRLACRSSIPAVTSTPRLQRPRLLRLYGWRAADSSVLLRRGRSHLLRLRYRLSIQRPKHKSTAHVLRVRHGGTGSGAHRPAGRCVGMEKAPCAGSPSAPRCGIGRRHHRRFGSLRENRAKAGGHDSYSAS